MDEANITTIEDIIAELKQGLEDNKTPFRELYLPIWAYEMLKNNPNYVEITHEEADESEEGLVVYGPHGVMPLKEVDNAE